MGQYEDVMMVEGADGHEADSAQGYYAGIQRMINAGNWSLQGSFGRTMMGAIESGHCMLGFTSCRDYWGNTVPGRDDVQEGTKGSYGFVAEAMGDEWADLMQAQA